MDNKEPEKENKRPHLSKVHVLKTWPDVFRDCVSGVKKFDYRKNDRDFAVGDVLILCEYDPVKKEYTGDEHAKSFFVTYILKDAPPEFGIPEGYCIMGIEPVLP